MAKTNKGEESRMMILQQARELLNTKGLQLTVEMIANELGLSRGRITHFFPTKDSLMVGIMRDYEHQISEKLHDFDWGQGPDFVNSLDILGQALDLQYDYRCAMAYLAGVSRQQAELHQHIEGSFFNRVDSLQLRTSLMVNSGLLQPQILDKTRWEVYCFQYTTLLTTWVISQELYYSKTAYARMKPIYLRGAMELFVPYLTPQGEVKFAEAMADV